MSNNVGLRAALWSGVGILIAAFWAGYSSIVLLSPGEPVTWILVRLTVPVALASLHFHFALSVYCIFLLNGVIYGLVAWGVEAMRHYLKPTR
jgi:hypothetical protein